MDISTIKMEWVSIRSGTRKSVNYTRVSYARFVRVSYARFVRVCYARFNTKDKHSPRRGRARKWQKTSCQPDHTSDI